MTTNEGTQWTAPLTVTLLRHGHAAALSPEWGGDRERSLTVQGRQKVHATAQWLHQVWVKPPQLVLCSPALRTRQTWEEIRNRLPQAALVLDSELYGHDVAQVHQTVLQHLSAGPWCHLMVMGHNPWLSELASGFTGRATPLEPAGAVVAELGGESWQDWAGPHLLRRAPLRVRCSHDFLC